MNHYGDTHLTEQELENAYEEMLDCDGPVTLAGMEYLPSRLLHDLDPIAYRTGLIDYADSLGKDGYVIEGYAE